MEWNLVSLHPYSKASPQEKSRSKARQESLPAEYGQAHILVA